MIARSQTHVSMAGDAQRVFMQYLKSAGIPDKSHSYYKLRADQFITAAGGRDPSTLKIHDIEKILQTFGRDDKLADWQFIQLVDAVRIFLVKCLKSDAAAAIDWSYWKSATLSLPAQHALTAKRHTPEELVFLKTKHSKSEYAEIRRQHRELIVRLVTEIRARGYSYRTEEAYEQWLVRFIQFCDSQSPEHIAPDQVSKYLHHLVISGNVSASTQNQALNALVFLYKRVLCRDCENLDNFARSKRKKNIPVVLSRSEVKALLENLHDWQRDVASLLYGTGMRLMEGLTLRVKDVDFHYSRIHVCQAKGKKDRFVPLPKNLQKALEVQIEKVRVLHLQDIEAGYGEALLPEALASKYPGVSVTSPLDL